MSYSYFNQDNHISIVVPKDCNVISHTDFDFLVIGPKKGNYQSNVGFKVVKGLENLNQELLYTIIANTQKDQIKDYNEFQEQKTQKKMINQHAAWIQHYNWTEEHTETKYGQLLCLAGLNTDRLLEVHAATLIDQEKEILPILLRIVESFRFIP